MDRQTEFANFKLKLTAYLAARTMADYPDVCPQRASANAERYVEHFTENGYEFEIWLAAKEDAKPLAEIVIRKTKVYGEDYGFISRIGSRHGFATRAAAEYSALAMGCRLS
jgi:hypothetical protein